MMKTFTAEIFLSEESYAAPPEVKQAVDAQLAPYEG